MRTLTNLSLGILFVGALAGGVAAQSAQPQQQAVPTSTGTMTMTPVPNSQANGAPAATVDEAIDRVIAREHDEVGTIRRYSPIIETYIQDMKPDKDLGQVPVSDHYFLGQADLQKGVVDNSMLAKRKDSKADDFNPLSHLGSYFKSDFVPEGFLQMVYLDTTGFDRQHYQFDYVRREFLGDVRCVVFDVRPLPKSGKGRFNGRIWAEDQNFTIVRFNGVYTPVAGINGFNLHFDSWRLNVQPGLWLPAYVFSQESDLKDFLGNHVRFRAQTRLWGYDLKNIGREEDFSNMTIEAPGQIQDQSVAAQTDRSPLEAERDWQHQAEVNVIERLERVGLLAPPGEMDKVMETVVNNIEVTNNLDIQPDIHCRVLLTGTLESFTIGHTIVISRGLLDVLPDEATLGTVIAQEMADIIVSKPSTDQWGFNDTTNVSTLEALEQFSFQDTPDQVQVASAKAVELLKNSPYKDKLAVPGLFLKQLDAESKQLPALISPHIGNRVLLYGALISTSPALDPTKIDQITALPIGSRLKLDPWNDNVALLKAKPLPLYSVRDKMPFEVTPFMPYLTRYDKTNNGGTIAAGPTKADLAKQEPPSATPQQ